MILTNKANLNHALVAAIQNDPYDKGDCDYSATELLKPPRQRALEKKYWDEIEVDVSDRIWSLYGQITHSILQRAFYSTIFERIWNFCRALIRFVSQGNMVGLWDAAKDFSCDLLEWEKNKGISEKRYFATIEGYRISCAIDLLEGALLSDYKFTSAWKAKKGADISDYVAQLNMQRWILNENSIELTKLQIVALLRDWSKLEAARSPEYPQMQVVVLGIPMWDLSVTKEYILQRIRLHEEAKVVLPLCSKEERWEKPTKFAVKKPGRISAIRLLDTEKEAHEYRAALPSNSNLYIEERSGESTRCLYYCDSKEFCDQFKRSKQ